MGLYYYKDESPAPSSPAQVPANSTMFWGLSQRLGNTERQLSQVMSAQSARQMEQIQEILNSQRQEREAWTQLLSRIDQNEQNIVGLENSTKILTLDQQKLSTDQHQLTKKVERNEQDIQRLQAELGALTKQVQALQMQQRGGINFRKTVSELKVEPKKPGVLASTDDDDGNGDDEGSKMTPRAAIFKDVYGRRRRLCRYCGQNFGASYCNKHERERVCLHQSHGADAAAACHRD